MLFQKNRLKKRGEIKKVFKEGKSFKENSLILKKMENDLTESRFCIIVSQKVSKKATIRNELKRRLRELIRQRLKEIKIGVDVLLITLPGIEKKDFSQLEENLDNILLKAKILK
ncbi:hypothetical protein AMJ49_00355 [Parcubacteria bacterium DG_74_2]|nr:MAG: hypothetical protein AMJ49_00355 [Parcubacteria bacterium DG_74_2]